MPTFKTFHDYVGQWDPDSGDEELTEKQRIECDKRFAEEGAQIKRHESRFAAVTPAFGHEVLPQHLDLVVRT